MIVSIRCAGFIVPLALPSSSMTYIVLFTKCDIAEYGKLKIDFLSRCRFLFSSFRSLVLNHKTAFFFLDTHRHSPLSTHNLFNFPSEENQQDIQLLRTRRKSFRCVKAVNNHKTTTRIYSVLCRAAPMP